MVVGQMTKEPGDHRTIVIDYTAELVEGEVLTAVQLTSRNSTTGADTTTTFLDTSLPVITSPLIAQRVRGGTHGETHLVQMRAASSLGNIYEHEVEVMVAEE